LLGAVVDCREPILPLTVIATDGTPVRLSVVVDTGFTDELTLPASAIRDLELPCKGMAEGVLGDGSRFFCDIYRGSLVWHDDVIAVDILETEGDPLLGMKLLTGSRLTMDITDDGQIEIVPLAHNG
jgi:clan AA aspartic protease